MSKRLLTVQNQNQNQETKIITRSATKRASTADPPTSTEEKTKKKKIEEKENHPQVEVESESDSDQSNDDEIDYPKNYKPRGIQGEDHPENQQYLVIDEGSSPIIVSKTALYWSWKYRQIIPHVYPDSYRMYIHADFNCYGELEIVENALLDLTKAIFIVGQGKQRKAAERVNYVHAFRRLEGLTILLDHTDGISGIDDGDRFMEFMRVIAACYVTILRGLLPKELFHPSIKIDDNLKKKLKKLARKIPNFAWTLERAMIIGDMYLHIGNTYSVYTNVIRIIYCNWIKAMEDRTIDLNQPAPKGKESLWKAMKNALEIEKNGIDEGGKESFNFLQELEKYRRQYRMGGNYHDLRTWSKAERAQYSFDRPRGGRGFWFF